MNRLLSAATAHEQRADNARTFLQYVIAVCIRRSYVYVGCIITLLHTSKNN